MFDEMEKRLISIIDEFYAKPKGLVEANLREYYRECLEDMLLNVFLPETADEQEQVPCIDFDDNYPETDSDAEIGQEEFDKMIDRFTE